MSTAPKLAPIQTRTILITSNKGGVGKTTTCVNIAATAAPTLNVVGIDYDPQRNFCKWGQRRPSDVASIRVIDGNLDQFQTALTRVAGCDLLIIDTPPGVGAHAAAIRTLAEKSDLVIVPTGTGIFDLETTIPWARGLQNIKGQKVVFCLNRIDTRTTRTDVRETKSLLLKAGRICPIPVRDLTDIERNMRVGKSVVDIPNHKGASDVIDLWHFAKQEMEL
jgi:chromosome partitioning protein